MSHVVHSPPAAAPSRRFAILILVALLLGGLLGYLMAPRNKKAAAGGPVGRFVLPAYDAAVGEWSVYRSSDGTRERWEVVASSAGEPHYKVNVVSMKDGAEPVELPARNLHRSMIGPNSFMLMKSIVYEPIKVAGRSWKSWRVEMFDPGVGTEYTYWVTSELPLHGWVRRRYVAMDTEYTYDIEEWGFTPR